MVINFNGETANFLFGYQIIFFSLKKKKKKERKEKKKKKKKKKKEKDQCIVLSYLTKKNDKLSPTGPNS
jgi:large-conductance mechanosensitive channel